MSDTIVFEGPDGRLYEVPADVLGRYAVPGDKVAALRAAKLGGGAAAAPAMPDGHFRPGEAPPGYPPPPEGIGPSSSTSSSSTAITVPTPGGGAVVLNFFFGPGGPGLPGTGGPHATAAPTQVEGYHMTFDAHGIPSNHHEMLWGDYIDKQGNPAVGWHSHDPVTGNAQ